MLKLLVEETAVFCFVTYVVNIVTCLGTSDTNLSRVRVSLTNNYGHMDFMIRGLFYNLRNLVATLHESHTNHFYYETQTRSSTSVCLLL
jgi:hypothetical protein